MRPRVLSWPSTRDGRQAAWLGLGVLGLFALDAALAAMEASEWGDGARFFIGLSGAVGLVAAIAAFVLTVRAVRKGDRSIVLSWPLVIGLAAVMFVIGELASPH